MQGFHRYAVYYVPEPDGWTDWLTSWLGWDIVAGRPLAQPALDRVDVETVTATPRKYGLHGTIKPPFHLAEGQTVQGLHDALAALCASVEPVETSGLKLARLGGFLALVPKGDTNALALLAAGVVSGLDDFRAPLTPAELGRRRAVGLSNRQDELLERWGYPFVMDEFRFHITLTGRMDDTEGEALRKRLKKIIKPMLPRPFRVASLCLVGEDENGLFHLIHRYPLST